MSSYTFTNNYFLRNLNRNLAKQKIFKEKVEKFKTFVGVLFCISIVPTCYIIAIFTQKCSAEVCDKSLLDPVYLHVLIWPSEVLRWVILGHKFILPAVMNLVFSSWSLLLLNKISNESKSLTTNSHVEKVRKKPMHVFYTDGMVSITNSILFY